MKKKTIPFALLGIIHLSLFLITLSQKKQKMLPLLFNSIGLAFLFEYFVLAVFKMYMYYPKVFKNYWIDSIFGGLLSQGIFIPVTAVFSVLFNIKWKWRWLAALGYGVIERRFIKWKVFKNYTWRTPYTILLIPFHFWLTQKVWEKLQKKDSLWLSKMTLLLTNWVNYTTVYFFLAAYFRLFLIRTYVRRYKFKGHFISGPIYTLYLAMICTLTNILPKWFKIIGLGILHLSDRLLKKLHILQLRKGTISIFIPFHIAMILAGEYIQKVLISFQAEKNKENARVKSFY